MGGMAIGLEIAFLLALVLVNRLGFVYVVNRKLHLTFVKNPALTFLYFVAMTALVALVFFPYSAELFHPGSILTVFFFLFVLFVLNPWAYRTLVRKGMVA